jgi:Response regulator containing a CheY-like receiver domain and an HTH DNA-binding domain
MKKIRVMIADDQELMCDGLKTILNNEEDMEVIAVVYDGLKAFEAACELHPDIILMDIRMPVMDGAESTRLVKKHCPQVKIIMLTTFDDDEYVLEALKNGANGYLLKSIRAEKLIGCIRDAAADIFSMNIDIASKFASKLAALTVPKEKISVGDFSEREVQVAELLAAGCTNREIAAALSIAEGTVKNYISIIYEKLGTSERVKASAVINKFLKK